MKKTSPIGVFDSGVGGLTVLKAIWQELPFEETIYIADQANVPYGTRPLEEVRNFSNHITQFFLSKNVKLIVIACNTASAAALKWLRLEYPNIPFVGMEPAVKPAVETTQSGAVGVLATPATFQGALYASVIERFASNVKIYQNTCPGLVEQIEKGQLNNSKTRAVIENAVAPFLDKNIDRIVLGCTHYPFVIPLIQDIVGKHVTIIEPAHAIARQVRRVLTQKNMLSPKQKSAHRFYTSGDPKMFQKQLKLLLNTDINVESYNSQC